MENTIIEIPVKVELLGTFEDYNSWLKHVTVCGQKLGLTSKLLHLDCNGFTTTGYDLLNTKRDTPYPVKTYLLLQDPEVEKPLPFKSLSNN